MATIPYPNPQAIFYQQYESVRRDEVIGILLALFLGGFGIHHFYLRNTGLGILYVCFSWTPIPWILGFIECFFMPGRVREFNAIQAAGIAAALGIPMPGWGQPMNVALNMPPMPQAGWTSQPVQAQAAQPSQGFSVEPSQASQVGTLLACSRCQQANAPGSRYCCACGLGL